MLLDSFLGKANTFLAIDPQLATAISGRTIDGEIRRIRPQNTHLLSREAVTNPGVMNSMVGTFSSAHIQNAVNDGRVDIISGMEANIKAMGPNRTARIIALSAINPGLARWLSKSPGNTFIDLN